MIGLKVSVPALGYNLKVWKGVIVKMNDNGDKDRCIVKLNRKNKFGCSVVSVFKSDLFL